MYRYLIVSLGFFGYGTVNVEEIISHGDLKDAFLKRLRLLALQLLALLTRKSYGRYFNGCSKLGTSIQ